MPDATTISTLVRFLVRSVTDTPPTKTRDDLKAISVTAFAAMSKGSQVIAYTFEGGNTQVEINCTPADLMTAAEQALLQTDPANPGAANGGRIMHEDLSCNRIET